MPKKFDDRGFPIYGELIDTQESYVSVKKSSLAEQNCVFILSNNEVSSHPDKYFPPHLNVSQAKRIVKPLEEFIFENESN